MLEFLILALLGGWLLLALRSFRCKKGGCGCGCDGCCSNCGKHCSET